jgi:hypothetical protein
MNHRFKGEVKGVLELLVAGKYAEMEALTHGVRLKAGAIAQSLAEYGARLVMPPEEGFVLMDVVEVKNAEPRRWSIAMPLWTAEEGRSDLTLEMTLIKSGSGFTIQLDDLHVL